ncbi:plasmid partitioning protein RepB [Amylibacter ulvae]|uniref:Plasmid partitioning protein RepB n=1 Tax=Paramylibacter ulvae TaxID=1651968 RepID=A0ABQ3D4X7_9RHOB|nr:plasmid partitioning protein RepB [Amylibacter ulvae]GHA59034.1 plasmid partitioning protein RepB [Amylibacter ulvae]
MARKNLLQGLMDDQPAKAAPKDDAPDETSNADAVNKPASPTPARSRYTKGAIGAVSQSIADLKSRSVSDIDPFLIDAGGVQDRLDYVEDEHHALMESIRDYGQQVPVLVRPHPDDPDRYQIVYGRRRVLALRDLGLNVKAMIRDLDDDALIMAQGQENTARKDLSFIEKANFARQMQDGGYARKTMCDALHIDKTVISRMLSIVERLPVEVIERIGAAPNVGRDRWLALANAFEAREYDANEAISVINFSGAETSDKRFDALFQMLTRDQGAKQPRKQPSTRTPLKTTEGLQIGEASWGNGKMTMTMNNELTDGFDEWLVEHISEIHARWKANAE